MMVEMKRAPTSMIVLLLAVSQAVASEAPAAPVLAPVVDHAVEAFAVFDLATFVLEREAITEPTVAREDASAAFERLVARCRPAVAAASDARGAIAALNAVLLHDHVIDYRSRDYWHDARLSTVLLERRGNCWALSLLYAAIGARLGLPLQVVREPGHALVRWDDGETVLDLETTDLGAVRRAQHEGPLRILAEPSALRAEVLRLELQRWLELGAVERAAASLALLAPLASDTEQALWRSHIDSPRGGTRIELARVATATPTDELPFGLRAEALLALAAAHRDADRLEAADAALSAASALVGRAQRAEIARARARIALARDRMEEAAILNGRSSMAGLR